MDTSRLSFSKMVQPDFQSAIKNRHLHNSMVLPFTDIPVNPYNFIIIASRPAMGKSMYAYNLLLQTEHERKINHNPRNKGLFYLPETDPWSLRKRLMYMLINKQAPFNPAISTKN